MSADLALTSNHTDSCRSCSISSIAF